MEPSILVVYATKHGSTREVADAVAARLRERGLDADCAPAADLQDPTLYSGVVVGGSLYMGRWHPDAVDFLRRHADALATMPVAVFALGPLTLKPAEVEGSRKQLGRALARVREVEPFSVAIFGGVVDPEKLRFPFNRMPASDARDWDAAHRWVDELAAAFGKAATEAGDLRSALQQTHR
jgi:menaquinone-dependent protoporphyrinogen oxidase